MKRTHCSIFTLASFLITLCSIGVLMQKLLYSPLGKLFILQPDEKLSPSHPLLPQGNALYALDKTKCGYSTSALRFFLNWPHPLATLSDPTAYGSDGTILRDHDSSNYLKAVHGVLRQHSRMDHTRMVFCKARKQKNMLWPLLTSPSPHSWSHEYSLQSTSFISKEVMTGVWSHFQGSSLAVPTSFAYVVLSCTNAKLLTHLCVHWPIHNKM